MNEMKYLNQSGQGCTKKNKKYLFSNRLIATRRHLISWLNHYAR